MNKNAGKIEKLSLLKKFSIFFAVSIFFISVPQLSFADTAPPEDSAVKGSSLKTEINKQSQALGGEKGAGYGDVALMSDTRLIAAEIIKIFFTFLGTMFSAYTLYGGYLWMTSAGNEERVTKSQSILVHGVIGIFVIFFSYTLVYFVERTVWKAYEVPFAPYIKWGTLPKGSQQVEGPDPLKGHNDPLEQLVPTPKFYQEPKK